MKIPRWLVAACLPLLPACASSAEWRSEDALAARMLEIEMDGSGRPLSIEYHIDPSAVPAPIRGAMEALHPGGTLTGAEKEFVGSDLFWELAKTIDGRKVEAMFHPDGRLRSEEVEIDVSSVPGAVRAAVAHRTSAAVTTWEAIHDREQKVVEYHAKVEVDGDKYKLRIARDGEVRGIVREIPAEVEVPTEDL